MYVIVAGHEAGTPDEFEELALGVGLDDEVDAQVISAVREGLHDLAARRFTNRLLRSADRARVRTWKAA